VRTMIVLSSLSMAMQMRSFERGAAVVRVT
jgi:hypothetical protein